MRRGRLAGPKPIGIDSAVLHAKRARLVICLIYLLSICSPPNGAITVESRRAKDMPKIIASDARGRLHVMYAQTGWSNGIGSR